MPAAVAALIRGEIRGKDVGLTIRRISAANERFGYVEIVVGAAQRSGSFKLTCIQARSDLSPSITGRLLIDRDPVCARSADRKRSSRLFMAGETTGLADELRSRSLQQRNTALNGRPDSRQLC